jgi:hypothetical protein
MPSADARRETIRNPRQTPDRPQTPDSDGAAHGASNKESGVPWAFARDVKMQLKAIYRVLGIANRTRLAWWRTRRQGR